MGYGMVSNGSIKYFSFEGAMFPISRSSSGAEFILIGKKLFTQSEIEIQILKNNISDLNGFVNFFSNYENKYIEPPKKKVGELINTISNKLLPSTSVLVRNNIVVLIPMSKIKIISKNVSILIETETDTVLNFNTSQIVENKIINRHSMDKIVVVPRKNNEQIVQTNFHSIFDSGDYLKISSLQSYHLHCLIEFEEGVKICDDGVIKDVTVFPRMIINGGEL